MMKLDNDYALLDKMDKIQKELAIANKLKLLEMARAAGICTEEEYTESLLNCRKVLFGK